MGFESAFLKPDRPEKVTDAMKEGDRAKIIELARAGGRKSARKRAEQAEINATWAEIDAERARAAKDELTEAEQMALERNDHLLPEREQPPSTA